MAGPSFFLSARRPGRESTNVNAGQWDLDGDARQERFLALFLPEQGAVRAFIRSIVWDRAHCEDLFQEVALVLWRELDRYDPPRRSSRACARPDERRWRFPRRP
jgi:hypothetical protein